jgi:hypothetical protein
MLPQDGGWMGRPGGGRHSAGLGDFDTERTIKDADKVLRDPQMAGMQAHNDFLGGVVRQTHAIAPDCCPARDAVHLWYSGSQVKPLLRGLDH